MNIKQAKQQIEYAVKAYLTRDAFGEPVIPVERQRPIFLLGAPGIGKTAIMEQVAQELGIGLVAYSMTHHTRQSALGLPFIVQESFDGEKYDVSEYTMSEIIASVHQSIRRSGIREGILFLDEINCVSETLAPSMLQFLQFKTFGRHRVPQGWVVVTAGNPPEYNSSVREFDVVTLDRLKRIDVEPDYGAWKEYALARAVHPAVTSYLEIRRDDFYRVESTVEGKRFVTARGWEDLSDMLKLFEQNGFPVDEPLIRQYLQNDAVAKAFAAYYDLFSKYRADYQVDRILAGEAGEDVLAQAREARFDERLSLLGLLTDGARTGLRAVLRREKALGELSGRLRARKAGFAGATPEAARALLTELADSLREETAARKAAGALSQEAITARRQAQALMEDYAAALPDGAEPFAWLGERFKGEQMALRAEAEAAKARLEHMFAFAEAAFPDGQELLILVTELSVDPDSARFIGKYGCDAYYRHNQSLMFYERGREIEREIGQLGLDDGE